MAKPHGFLAQREHESGKFIQSRLFRQYRWAERWARQWDTSWSVTPLYQYCDSRPKDHGVGFLRGAAKQ